MSFVDILISQKKIKPDKATLASFDSLFGEDLEKKVKTLGVSNDDILKARSEFLNTPIFLIKEDMKIPYEILRYIPEDSAKYYKIVPIIIRDSVLEVGMLRPDDVQSRDALQFISSKLGIPLKIFLVSKQDFEKVLEMYKGLRGTVTKALSQFGSEEGDEVNVNLGAIKEDTVEDEKITEDAPVTKIVSVILRHATEGNASDVHIEPIGEKVRVRFRVDGELFTSLFLPKNVQSAIVARIKVLSQLKLDEKRKPQDGSFTVYISEHKIDFRVSTLPTAYGEKVVMRILDSSRGVKKLEELGLSVHNLALIKKSIKKTHGIILITGPTGSGKTTTLYSMLNAVDKEKYNVVSLENPIEYKMQGVSQSQVKPEIGYTFANGLRSILRQDPDIIMVGEIRDKETAQLAIQAALTGHLVFATLHTNSAIGAIPRLINMGVDQYLIAPTLILAIAQRLARVTCADSKVKMKMNDSMKEMVRKQFEDLPDEHKTKLDLNRDFYTIKPSKECPMGTNGRVAVLEILEIDKSMEKVILTDPTEVSIWELARKKGMLSMKEDAMLKVFDGTIPFEEINKV